MADTSSSVSGNAAQADLQLLLSIPDLSLSDYGCEFFTAEEAVSRPFRVEVFFISTSDLTGASIVGKSAWFRVKQDDEAKSFGGIVTEFRLLNKADMNSYTYCVVIGPRLLLLDHTQQSAVFAAESALGLKSLLDGVLSGSLYEGATVSDRGVILDYEIRDSVSDNFQRKNITKYNESDFKFFSRTCERYGVFYYFEHIDANGRVKDNLIIAASNLAFPLSSASPMPFRPTTTTTGVRESAVTSLEWVARSAPKLFKLRDFSEQKPDTDMLVSGAQSDADGVGAIVEHGDHYLTRDEGEILVAIRSEEAAWQANIFECESTNCALGAGQIFQLQKHDIDSFNAEYVVLEARHTAGTPGALGYVTNATSTPYRGKLTAIKKSQPFRPRRVTPRPVMAGVFNAMVEAEDSTTTRAAIDQNGGYRLGLGYNEAASRNTPGKGTAPIRRVQPYAGSSTDNVVSGMHFPLVNNTEVLVGYVNGDPDRPVILGAAFNQNNADPVTSNDHTANVIRTTSGLLMEMKDGASKTAPRFIRFDVPKNVTDTEPSGTYLRLGGSADDGGLKTGLASSGATENSAADTSAEESGTSQTGVLLYSDDGMDLNVRGSGLMKFGSGQTTETEGGDSVHTVTGGKYALTASNDIALTSGSGKKSAGDLTMTVGKNLSITTKGDSTSKTTGSSSSTVSGSSSKTQIGNSFSIFVGAEESIKLSTAFSFYMGVKADISLTMLKFDAAFAMDFKLALGISMIIKKSTIEIQLTETKTTASKTTVTVSDLETTITKLESKITEIESSMVKQSSDQVRVESCSIESLSGSIRSDSASLVAQNATLLNVS